MHDGGQFLSDCCTAGVQVIQGCAVNRQKPQHQSIVHWSSSKRSYFFYFILFCYFFYDPVLVSLGETEPTVRTRQDSPGAGGQDTHFERGQGFHAGIDDQQNDNGGAVETHSVCLVTPQCGFCPGQAGVCARRLPPADGAVQGAAGPRGEDRLPAEAAAGGRGAHQG